MPVYYVMYPVILQQSLATLFPYLETLRDHLIRSDTASPFSGAAARERRPCIPKTKKDKQPQQQQQQHRFPRWSPTGPVVFAAAPPSTTITDVTQYVAEIQRLHEAMAAMGGSPGYGAQFGMRAGSPLPPRLTRTCCPPVDPANTIAGSMGRTTPTMEANAM